MRRTEQDEDELETSSADEVEQATGAIVPDRGASSTQDQGKTIIADGVVAKIAALAAKEVDGVHELVSQGIGQAVTGLARAVARQTNMDRGILVEVGEKETAIDVRLCALYGASIPEMARKVRSNIIERVQNLTGLRVKVVNIAVVDLYFPGEEAEPSPPRRVE